MTHGLVGMACGSELEEKATALIKALLQYVPPQRLLEIVDVVAAME